MANCKRCGHDPAYTPPDYPCTHRTSPLEEFVETNRGVALRTAASDRIWFVLQGDMSANVKDQLGWIIQYVSLLESALDRVAGAWQFTRELDKQGMAVTVRKEGDKISLTGNYPAWMVDRL